MPFFIPVVMVIVRVGAPIVIRAVIRETVKQAPKIAREVVKQAPKATKQATKKTGRKKPNAATNKYNDKAKKEKEKKKKGPCDHLKKGNGKGDYRGGAHSETSKPRNDGKDSHHMPADESSPLPKKDGPAIQMDPTDHRDTSSNGNKGLKGVKYRGDIKDLISQGKWRDAMAKEIKDVRRISRKYKEAIKEALAYFKCLEKNGLLTKAG